MREPRQFDISDRNRHRFTFLVTGAPDDRLSVNAQVGIFREERPDTEFGVLNTDGNFYSLGVDVTPVPKVAMGLTGAGTSTSRSSARARRTPACRRRMSGAIGRPRCRTMRTRSTPTWICSRRVAKTDIRYAFDWMDGLNDTTYGLRPDQTIFTTVPLIQLPNASHTITRSMLDVMYRVNRRFGAGAVVVLRELRRERLGLERLRRPVRQRQRDRRVPPSPTVTLNNITLNPPGQSNTVAQYFAVTRYMYRPVRRQHLLAPRAGILLVRIARQARGGAASGPPAAHLLANADGLREPGRMQRLQPGSPTGAEHAMGSRIWLTYAETRGRPGRLCWHDGAHGGTGSCADRTPSEARLSTPSRSVRCATRSPGKATPRARSTASATSCRRAEIKEWIVNPKEMTTKTKAERKPPMKAYPNLPAADVDALVAYMQTLKKP